MIVSYSRNFIFIKTKKTAGSTVEAILATACVGTDIVTYPSDIFIGTDPATLGTAPGRDRPEDRGREDKRSGKNPDDFFNHMSARQAHARVDRHFWDSALKLTVERHPYEKAVSFAYFTARRKCKTAADFPAHLDRVVRGGDFDGFKRWSIDGKVAVDEFVRQESLQEDLGRMGMRLGIAIPAELPRLKSRTRTDPRPAREILSREQKDIVFARCRREFEILGYDR
jgi:hypothetical protein